MGFPKKQSDFHKKNGKSTVFVVFQPFSTSAILVLKDVEIVFEDTVEDEINDSKVENPKMNKINLHF